MRLNCVFAIIQCYLFIGSFADLKVEQKEKFLHGFLDYLNNLPNHQYNYEGDIIDAQKIVSMFYFYNVLQGYHSKEDPRIKIINSLMAHCYNSSKFKDYFHIDIFFH